MLMRSRASCGRIFLRGPTMETFIFIVYGSVIVFLLCLIAGMIKDGHDQERQRRHWSLRQKRNNFFG